MNYELTSRLQSLDVLRGLTVFGMIIVNNGVGHEQFSTLQHSKWNGLTPCDLVFPFFLFMVGVSMWLSLKKTNFTPSKPLVWKIAKRTVILFAIGVLLHAWDALIGGKEDILANLRVWGVLERIALCYGIGSIILLYVKPARLWTLIIGLLVLYSCLLIWGNGYAEDETNIACVIDRVLFSEAHLYHKSPIDPEGLLGTISALAHTLIGVIVGKYMTEKKLLSERLLNVLLLAFAIGILGYLLQFGLPLNKRIWSPSYVLVTCALASGLLALFAFLIDEKGHTHWCALFRMFGMNAFFLYVLSEMLSPVFGALDIPEHVFSFYYSFLHSSEWSSALYSLTFDGIFALTAWVMWKRQWFVKI